MKKLSKKTIIIIALVAMTLVGLYGAYQFKSKHRNAILESPLAQRMIPMYRSLRKLPDIVYMPWSAFANSELKTFELSISPKNIELMNEALPDMPFNSDMQSGEAIWVSGYFRAEGYEDNVDVRYRGNLASHWNAYQKSYSIEFPKDNLFKGMREMNLIIPSKRRYLGMSFNDYRARKLDLISPSEELVHFELNGADMGVMLSFEKWSQEWIEKLPVSALSTLYGVDEGKTPYQERWDSWNSDEPIDFTPLETLEEIVEHTSDEEFKRIIPTLIDIEDWYRWDVMRILASGYHVSGDTSFGANNLVMIFERSEGRFKPVPYNTVIYTPSFREAINNPGQIGYPTRLYQRILSIPEFRARRDEIWNDYTTNEKEADLKYLADWQSKYNREFLLDNAKNDNHFMYLSKIKENITAAELHFDDPFGITKKEYEVSITEKEILDIPTEFKYLTAASLDVKSAAKQHPSIIETQDGLLIPTGSHWFDQTIIIPTGTKLTIAKGARLNFDEDVSFISYSPIIAEGTQAQPIILTGYKTDSSWGVFAVLNTETATSSLNYVMADSGGEDTINGAYISGTIAFHNSNAVITNSEVRNAQGDDGINVKGSRVVMTDNTLTENSSDGVDLDFISEDSVIERNLFVGNKGDGLDISWSNITINDNDIDTCVDKGISVGESSQPTILNNQISNCAIGIAIKDSSIATIAENTISNAQTAISAYQKKAFFSGGTGELSGNILIDNRVDYFIDNSSKLFLNGEEIEVSI